jgi:hypothetical protein
MLHMMLSDGIIGTWGTINGSSVEFCSWASITNIPETIIVQRTYILLMYCYGLSRQIRVYVMIVYIIIKYVWLCAGKHEYVQFYYQRTRSVFNGMETGYFLLLNKILLMEVQLKISKKRIINMYDKRGSPNMI